MTLEEIKRQYPNEWVLIEFTELDDELQVVDGQVIAHSPSRDVIDKKLMVLRNDKIAVEFTGEEVTEEAYLRTGIERCGSDDHRLCGSRRHRPGSSSGRGASEPSCASHSVLS